jgi:hypothetical protein
MRQKVFKNWRNLNMGYEINRQRILPLAILTQKGNPIIHVVNNAVYISSPLLYHMGRHAI